MNRTAIIAIAALAALAPLVAAEETAPTVEAPVETPLEGTQTQADDGAAPTTETEESDGSGEVQSLSLIHI